MRLGEQQQGAPIHALLPWPFLQQLQQQQLLLPQQQQELPQPPPPCPHYHHPQPLLWWIHQKPTACSLWLLWVAEMGNEGAFGPLRWRGRLLE